MIMILLFFLFFRANYASICMICLLYIYWINLMENEIEIQKGLLALKSLVTKILLLLRRL